jgi:hypothetical protein
VYLRRTNQLGEATMLGQNFPVDRNWAGRLVRCEVALQEALIKKMLSYKKTPGENLILIVIFVKFGVFVIEIINL